MRVPHPSDPVTPSFLARLQIVWQKQKIQNKTSTAALAALRQALETCATGLSYQTQSRPALPLPCLVLGLVLSCPVLSCLQPAPPPPTTTLLQCAVCSLYNNPTVGAAPYILRGDTHTHTHTPTGPAHPSFSLPHHPSVDSAAPSQQAFSVPPPQLHVSPWAWPCPGLCIDASTPSTGPSAAAAARCSPFSSLWSRASSPTSP